MSGTIAEIAGKGLSPEAFQRDILQPCRPVILRGLVADWPAVTAARRSPAAFRDYLAQFDAGGSLEVFWGKPEIAGKYYYDGGLTGFNFERRRRCGWLLRWTRYSRISEQAGRAIALCRIDSAG